MYVFYAKVSFALKSIKGAYMQKTPIDASSLPENKDFKLKFLLEMGIFYDFRVKLSVLPSFLPENFSMTT